VGAGVSNGNSLAHIDAESLLDEIASGVLSKVIAARYKVTPYGLRKRLSKHPDYQQAIKDQAESFVEDALHEMMECPADQVAITRARARFDCAHKWAMARDPAKWGPKQSGESGGVTVVIKRDSVEITHDATQQRVNLSRITNNQDEDSSVKSLPDNDNV
jgi:hypothetical protein